MDSTNSTFTPKSLTDAEYVAMIDHHTARSADHTSAYWYAWGRLDQGHEPVVNAKIYSTKGTPDTTTTAWWFAHLYDVHKTEAANGGGSCGLPSAWQNFVASKGNQVGWIR